MHIFVLHQSDDLLPIFSGVVHIGQGAYICTASK